MTWKKELPRSGHEHYEKGQCPGVSVSGVGEKS